MRAVKRKDFRMVTKMGISELIADLKKKTGQLIQRKFPLCPRAHEQIFCKKATARNKI